MLLVALAAAGGGIEILGLDMMASTKGAGCLLPAAAGLSGEEPSMKVDLRLNNSSSSAPKRDSKGEKMLGTRLGAPPMSPTTGDVGEPNEL